MYSTLLKIIGNLEISSIPQERKDILQPLINYIQNKVGDKSEINLNFICTHNSRRSHLSQIWAQTMASYYQIKNVGCYSGGTEATAMFPKVAEILTKQGFRIKSLSEGDNPVYSIKFSDNGHPIIGFSKRYDDDFNPKSNFAAIMTCSHANDNCPFVFGCDTRIPITYEDPKSFDNSPNQTEKYLERSVEIATELKHVFSKINQ